MLKLTIAFLALAAPAMGRRFLLTKFPIWDSECAGPSDPVAQLYIADDTPVCRASVMRNNSACDVRREIDALTGIDYCQLTAKPMPNSGLLELEGYSIHTAKADNGSDVLRFSTYGKMNGDAKCTGKYPKQDNVTDYTVGAKCAEKTLFRWEEERVRYSLQEITPHPLPPAPGMEFGTVTYTSYWPDADCGNETAVMQRREIPVGVCVNDTHGVKYLIDTRAMYSDFQYRGGNLEPFVFQHPPEPAWYFKLHFEGDNGLVTRMYLNQECTTPVYNIDANDNQGFYTNGPFAADYCREEVRPVPNVETRSVEIVYMRHSLHFTPGPQAPSPFPPALPRAQKKPAAEETTTAAAGPSEGVSGRVQSGSNGTNINPPAGENTTTVEGTPAQDTTTNTTLTNNGVADSSTTPNATTTANGPAGGTPIMDMFYNQNGTGLLQGGNQDSAAGSFLPNKLVVVAAALMAAVAFMAQN